MPEKLAYCTYFDSGYLSRGLALIQSLRENGDDSPVWIMALDDAAHAYLTDANLPGVTSLRVAELEAAIPELASLRAERSRMEYYFTTTPLLVKHVMAKYSEPTTVIYLDADLYFYGDPAQVVTALGDGSVGIIEHRYQPRLARRLAKYGRFNVGWVGFRSDERGTRVLDWWGQSTLEWCGDTPTDGKYADQGYLDRFPDFEGVTVLGSQGFNLAPWNTAGRDIRSTEGGVTIDGDPLVFFHFHGVKRTKRWWMTSQLVYSAWLTRVLRDDVYEPYVRRLEEIERGLAASPLLATATVAPRGAGLRGVLFRAQKAVLGAVNVLTGSAIPINRS